VDALAWHLAEESKGKEREDTYAAACKVDPDAVLALVGCQLACDGRCDSFRRDEAEAGT
jgi:hypothetical protein